MTSVRESEWKYNPRISFIDSDNENEIIGNEEAETLLGDPVSQDSQMNGTTIVNVGSLSSRGSAQSVFTSNNNNKSILPTNLSIPAAQSRLPPGSKKFFH